jgi:microcystin-dependent protein
MDPYIGEVRMFAGNFAPQGWATCDGQNLSIADYQTLFSLIGTTYGGDGQVTFRLPDLRSRLPLHQGQGQRQGQGLSSRVLGEVGGVETVTLTAAQLPGHTHVVSAAATPATGNSPAGLAWAQAPNSPYYQGAATPVAMGVTAVSAVGGSQPHDNVAPFTTVTFIIALVGLYPARS